MGCCGSKFAGDDFKDVDATLNQGLRWPSNKKTSHFPASAPSQKIYTHATPTTSQDDRKPQEDRSSGFGSHANMGTLSSTGKSKDSKQKKKKKAFMEIPSEFASFTERSIDEIALRAAPRRLILDGKELKGGAYTHGTPT